MSITRFDKDMDGSMEPSERGRWVSFDDVRARLEVAERMAQALGKLTAAIASADGPFDIYEATGAAREAHAEWEALNK